MLMSVDVRLSVGGSIKPDVQLLLTLEILCNKQDFVGVSVASACRIVRRVSESIAALRSIYFHMASSDLKLDTAAAQFYAIARFQITNKRYCTTMATHDETIVNNNHLKQRFEAGHFRTKLFVEDADLPSAAIYESKELHFKSGDDLKLLGKFIAHQLDVSKWEKIQKYITEATEKHSGVEEIYSEKNILLQEISDLRRDIVPEKKRKTAKELQLMELGCQAREGCAAKFTNEEMDLATHFSKYDYNASGSANDFDDGDHEKGTLMKVKRNSQFYLGLSHDTYFLIELLVENVRAPQSHILIVLKKIRLNDSFTRLAIDFSISKGWRKVQQLGLASEYKNQQSPIGNWLNHLFGLTFLPPAEVGECFAQDFMSDKPQDSKVDQFTDYLVDTYIDSDSKFLPEIIKRHEKKYIRRETLLKQQFIQSKIMQLNRHEVSHYNFVKCVSYKLGSVVNL
nr:unnamed protein product [Callosobruchus analis]